MSRILRFPARSFCALACILTAANTEMLPSPVAAADTAEVANITPIRSAAHPNIVFKNSEVVQEFTAEPSDRDDDSNTALEPLYDANTLAELLEQMPTQNHLSAELKCLATAVYFEARGEMLDGQLAVAEVVINRTDSQKFPTSYCGVVKQASQFSFVRNGRMPNVKTASLAWQNAKKIAVIADRGMWKSAVGDALYFHARRVNPAWAQGKTKLAAIDTHIFYR